MIFTISSESYWTGLKPQKFPWLQGIKKILPSNVLFLCLKNLHKNQIIFGVSCVERSLHIQHNEGFRISDPPKNTGEDSEFRIHQRTQRSVQNFWSTKKHRRGFRISDPPKNTTKGSEFLIHQKTQERIQNFGSPKVHNERFRIWTPI